MLSSLSSDLTSAKVMAEEKVIRSLLSFVTRNDKVVAPPWNPAQFEELQLLVSHECVTYLLVLSDTRMCNSSIV